MTAVAGCQHCRKITRAAAAQGTVRVVPWEDHCRSRQSAESLIEYLSEERGFLAAEGPQPPRPGGVLWRVRAYFTVESLDAVSTSPIGKALAPQVVLRSALLALPYVSERARAAA